MLSSPHRVGVACALAAYGLWGAFPIFWRLLAEVPAVELVCHRILWSTVILAIGIPLFRRFGGGVGAEIAGLGRPSDAALPMPPSRRLSIVKFSVMAAAVISANWLSFIGAVNSGHVVEASLGYFISPLFSVALGVMVLRERLSRWQCSAIVTAMLGVLIITIASQAIPWVSLVIASSFAVYGLLKKNFSIPALVGLLFENLVLILPASGYLLWLTWSGSGTMGNQGRQIDLLLMLGGLVTIPPLMFFALAARRVALSTIGMLQYISPTLQFLLGTQLVGQRLDLAGWLGFSCVWAGCALYVLGTHKAMRYAAR